jgi:hypothetical protein
LTTVSELIERLSEFDPNMLVSINNRYGIEWGEVRLGSRSVELYPDIHVPDVSDVAKRLRDAIDDADSVARAFESALDDIDNIIDDLEDLGD